MLKIQDRTGKVIGILKDEDNAPEMDPDLPTKEDLAVADALDKYLKKEEEEE